MKTSPFYSYHFSIYSNNPAVRFTVVLSGNFISIAIKRLFSNLSPLTPFPYKASRADCPLHGQCSVKAVWIRPLWEYRKLCSIPRDSEEWNGIYSKRTAVERVNSKLKEHRRLNTHCHRGLAKVRLHCLMSVLSLTISALAEANANHVERVRACTRKVA